MTWSCSASAPVDAADAGREVHAITNLQAGGSSVFATGGSANHPHHPRLVPVWAGVPLG